VFSFDRLNKNKYHCYNTHIYLSLYYTIEKKIPILVQYWFVTEYLPGKEEGYKNDAV